jgi:hypothetical protein
VRPPFQRLLDETLDPTRSDTNGDVKHNHKPIQDDDDKDMSDDDHGSQALQDDDEYDSDNSEGAVEEEVDGNIRNSLAEAIRVLKDEDLAICTSRIQGFALDSKRWSKFCQTRKDDEESNKSSIKLTQHSEIRRRQYPRFSMEQRAV